MLSSSLSLSLAALVLIPRTLAQDTNATCQSFGVDFQNNGSYFINSLSNASFTCVTQFSGCNNDTASVILVDPNEDGYDCTDIPTPDGVPEMSTCDIEKNQMFSGEWEILVLGNNGPEATDPPFAFQRNFYIDCGPQQTTTVTPTLTYTQTITPTVSSTNTSTVWDTITASPTQTVVEPASTVVITTTPAPVTTTAYKTVTKTYKTWTQTKTTVTEAVTPSCIVPPIQPFHDPVCSFLPRGVQLPAGLNIPGLSHAKRDTPMNSAAVRKRFEAIQARRAAAAAKSAAQLNPEVIMDKRAADQPTITVNATLSLPTTSIVLTGSVSTAWNLTITTETTTSALPPVTIHSGVEVTTITAPTPTATSYKVTYTGTTVTKTMTGTVTKHIVIAPTESVWACKKQGGHFGPGYAGWW